MALFLENTLVKHTLSLILGEGEKDAFLLETLAD